jgi:hypothetical protein
MRTKYEKLNPPTCISMSEVRRMRAMMLVMTEIIDRRDELTPILKVSLIDKLIWIEIYQGPYAIYSEGTNQAAHMGIVPLRTKKLATKNCMFSKLATALRLPDDAYGFIFLWSSAGMQRLYFIGSGRCYIQNRDDYDDNELSITYLDYMQSCQALLNSITELGSDLFEIYKPEWSDDYLQIN